MIWKIHTADLDLIRRLQADYQCSEIIARVIANRGLESLEQSRSFFTPSLDQLHDPFRMRDMDQAVERVVTNIQSSIPIMIFGDYDVDGTTGASTLYRVFKALGARVSYYIPDREREGYGLSLPGINAARERGADLVITCDCGINAFDQVKHANKLGIDVIITDHHTPDTSLPAAYAILNPKRPDCDYPFKGLCGGGVAFKLAWAVTMTLDAPIDYVLDTLELITLGTAADMVPIRDENRILVYHGLSKMMTSGLPGIRALMETGNLAGNGKQPSVGNLVFTLAPRINAAGRLGDANRAVELLTTNDDDRALILAQELDKENRRRQDIQQQVVEEALRMVNAEVDLSRDRAIVLWEKDWHPGVIGIAASRIKEEFHRPTIIIALDGQGLGKGSARSIPGLDLYQTLTECKEFLEGYGGHPMAAGLTIQQGKLSDFRQMFLAEVNKVIQMEDLEPRISLDGVLPLKDIDTRFMSFLEKLGPFGPGNMRPKFASQNLKVVGNPRLVGNGDHLRFKVSQNRRTFDAIAFNMADHYETLIQNHPVDLAYVVEENEWQGVTSIQLNVRDIRLSEEVPK